MSVKFGDCSSCVFIQSKSITVRKVYHGIAPPIWPVYTSVISPFQVTARMPPLTERGYFPEGVPAGTTHTGMYGKFLKWRSNYNAQGAFGDYTWEVNQDTGQISGPPFPQAVSVVSVDRPNTNIFETLVDELDSQTFDGLDWDQHRTIDYTSGSRSVNTFSSTFVFEPGTSLDGSGGFTSLTKTRIRTNGMVCLQNIRLTGGQPSTAIVRDFGQSSGITEMTIERPSFWGRVAIFARDPNVCGIDTSVPTACYPHLA